MNIARTIFSGCCLMFLLVIGAAALSQTQQPKDTTVTPSHARAELRERVLTLRTEVDVLQLEFDATRATILECRKTPARQS